RRWGYHQRTRVARPHPGRPPPGSCAQSHMCTQHFSGRMAADGAEGMELRARRVSLPPGPGYPAAVQMLGFWTRPLAFLERCREQYGRRFTVRLPLTPPFVMLTTPEEIKEVFTAPADVLHPGAGARVLEPVVGRNSVILLDGDA